MLDEAVSRLIVRELTANGTRRMSSGSYRLSW